MSATYWVLVSDDLADEMDESRLPEGLRFTGHAPVAPLPPYALGNPAAASWRQVADDDAGPELEGHQVELILGRRGRNPAKTVIIERRLLA
jgi:hypothetical protein